VRLDDEPDEQRCSAREQLHVDARSNHPQPLAAAPDQMDARYIAIERWEDIVDHQRAHFGRASAKGPACQTVRKFMGEAHEGSGDEDGQVMLFDGGDGVGR
jgi:hypothetical protein